MKDFIRKQFWEHAGSEEHLVKSCIIYTSQPALFRIYVAKSVFLLLMHWSFVQGVILGPISILALFGLVFKYFAQEPTFQASVGPYWGPQAAQNSAYATDTSECVWTEGLEPVEWLNMLLESCVDAHRALLRDGQSIFAFFGLDEEHFSQKRIENFANANRPSEFGHIDIHFVRLGHSAPKLSNARQNRGCNVSSINFDVTYADDLQLSFSSIYETGFPIITHVHVAAVVSLDLFKSSMTLTLHAVNSSALVLAIGASPAFTLDISTRTSVEHGMGTFNTILKDEIREQVRKAIAGKTWEFALPSIPMFSHYERNQKSAIQ